jgi:transcriptional regulator with PAS, ATPase and Fis domain
MNLRELTTEPSLKQIGTLVRDVFDLWIGFVDNDGAVYPIGDGDANTEKPVCEAFKRRSVPANRDESRQTCAQSVEEWADCELDSQPEMLSCHAGFSSMIWRLPNREGRLYISGFLESKTANQQLNKLEERLSEEGLDASISFDKDNISIFKGSMLGIVEKIGNHLVSEVEEIASSEQKLQPISEPFHHMVGESPIIERVFETIQRVGPSNSSVLIRGENGTGKELIARAIHRESPRSNRPFLALNCASVPADLIASELFGHKEGAFSGANQDRIGICEEAQKGTLFLDEIAEMTPQLQVKLLRFLQDGTFSPVGSNERRSVDVRVLCATNRDLEALIRAGDFREDLYFRLNVVEIEAPPLRHRRSDIPRLASYFLMEHVSEKDEKRWSDEAIEVLKQYEWPGNVRELENEVERAVLMSGDDAVLEPKHLSKSVSGVEHRPTFVHDDELTLPEAKQQLEKSMILNKLEETGWNKSQTARELDVSRRNIIRKVSTFDLESYRDDE